MAWILNTVKKKVSCVSAYRQQLTWDWCQWRNIWTYDISFPKALWLVLSLTLVIKSYKICSWQDQSQVTISDLLVWYWLFCHSTQMLSLDSYHVIDQLSATNFLFFTFLQSILFQFFYWIVNCSLCIGYAQSRKVLQISRWLRRLFASHFLVLYHHSLYMTLL